MGPRRGQTQDRHGMQGVFRLVWIGLVVAAVVKELRMAPEERTWHGVVAGFVPYEFRRPTGARIRERIWDPENEHLFTPHAFGVGWTLNVGRVFALIRKRFSDEG